VKEITQTPKDTGLQLHSHKEPPFAGDFVVGEDAGGGADRREATAPDSWIAGGAVTRDFGLYPVGEGYQLEANPAKIADETV